MISLLILFLVLIAVVGYLAFKLFKVQEEISTIKKNQQIHEAWHNEDFELLEELWGW